MRHHRIAMRYAKGLLGYSQEKGSLEAAFGEVVQLKAQLEASRDFRVFLRSPVIDYRTKEKVISQIMKGFSKTLLHFVQLMIRQHREPYLYDTTKAFIGLYHEVMGLSVAQVTTAVPLDEAMRQRLLAKLKTLTQGVQLEERVDPSLLGGFILRVGDQQFDQSVVHKLKVLRKDFEENAYISRISN